MAEKALAAVIGKSRACRPARSQASRAKSQVSRLCGEIDDRLPIALEGGPYLWLETYVKVREAGRIVSVAVTVAVAVNDQGRREVLGMAIGASEVLRIPALAGPARAARREAGDLRRPQGSEGRRDPDPRRHLAKMPRALRPQPVAHAGRQGRRVVSAFVATAFAGRSPTSSGPRCPSWTKPSTTSSPGAPPEIALHKPDRTAPCRGQAPHQRRRHLSQRPPSHGSTAPSFSSLR